MMDRIVLRKPKLHFDVVANASHVTFDDGSQQRRNFPWVHYVETRWDYADLDTIKIVIADWIVVITGHNLGPLFEAIEDRTLTRVRAQPELKQDSERVIDTFATEIRFLQPPPGAPAKRVGQIEFNLGA
jgi:hypothetical protein